MLEFARGSDQQFRELKASLEDGRCHIYRCTLPSGCSVQGARLGFEKIYGENYAVFLDKGIQCHRQNAPAQFRTLLATGTLQFLEFNDLKCFLKGLAVLYR